MLLLPTTMVSPYDYGWPTMVGGLLLLTLLVGLPYLSRYIFKKPSPTIAALFTGAVLGLAAAGGSNLLVHRYLSPQEAPHYEMKDDPATLKQAVEGFYHAIYLPARPGEGFSVRRQDGKLLTSCGVKVAGPATREGQAVHLLCGREELFSPTA